MYGFFRKRTRKRTNGYSISTRTQKDQGIIFKKFVVSFLKKKILMYLFYPNDKSN